MVTVKCLLLLYCSCSQLEEWRQGRGRGGGRRKERLQGQKVATISLLDKTEHDKEVGHVQGESEGRSRGRKVGKKRNLRKPAWYETIHKMPPRADCIKGISRIKQPTNRQRCKETRD